MITFLEHLLIENRIEALKTKVFKDGFDTSHDTNAKHKETSDIVDHFANNADPTTKKTHTQWILNQYKKKNVRQEDHPRIKDALTAFDTHKGKLDKKDINQYKRLSDVESAVEPHMGTAGSKKQEKKAVKAEGADLIHNDEKLGVTVHHMKTKAAACQYGSGTRWCTAAKNHNMFDDYNKDGPIHVIQHQGRKYQYHNHSEQFMDEEDNPFHMKDVHPDIQKSLANSDHPDIVHANIKFGNPHITSKHLSQALESDNAGLRRAVFEHPKVQPHHISKGMQDSQNFVRMQALEHPNATAAHLHAGLKDSYPPTVRHVFMTKSPNLDDTHTEIGINHEDSRVRSEAFRRASKAQLDKHIENHIHLDGVMGATRNPNLQPKHIDHLLDSRFPGVRQNAISHKNASSKNISKALRLGDDNDDRNLLGNALNHKNFGLEHIDQVLNNNRSLLSYFRVKAMTHPMATPDHIDKALDDESHSVRASAIIHKNATPKNLMKALDDNDPHINELAAEHKNNDKESLLKAVGHKNANVAMAGLKNEKIDSDHVGVALQHPKAGVRRAAAMKRAITSDQLMTAMKDRDRSVTEIALMAHHNDKITEKHLDTALKHHPLEDVSWGAVSHPKATQKHWDTHKANWKKEGTSKEELENYRGYINDNRAKHKLEPFK